MLSVISRSPSDIHPVLDAIVDTAARLCRGDFAILWELRDGRYHVASIARGASPELAAYARDNPISPGPETLVGRVALDGATVHIPDVTLDPEYRWSDGRWSGLLQTMLGVPLLRDGVVTGVIAVHRRLSQAFSQREIDLVTTFADQAVIAINNVGLFKEVEARTAELQQSLEYQTATADVLNVISRAPSQLQPVFELIVETAARLCEANSATVFQLADDGRYHLTASHGYSPEYRELLRRRPLSPGRDTAIGRMAVECRTIQIEDTLCDPDYMFHEAQKLGGYRSILAVPLLQDGKAIAAIALGRSAVRPFSAKQIQLVETFADQAVIAINNVRLFEEVQARTRELTEALDQQTATSDVLQAISRSTFDLQTVLNTLVEFAARLCDADSVGIMRPDGPHFRFTAHHGYSPAFVEHMTTVAMTAGRGSITGRVLSDGSIVHVPDVLADPEYAWTEAQKIGGYCTVLGVPLLREGAPIGVMNLTRSQVRPFSDKQIELVKTFADQAVIAIENARLFDQVQARTRELARSVEELRALGEVSQAVNSTLDLQTVLSTIVAKTVQLSAAEAGAIYVFSKHRQKFRLRATYGMSEAMISDFEKQSVGLGESCVGKAAATRDALQVADLMTEPASPIRDLILKAGYRALLVVPLMRSNSVVGALVVRRKEPGLFPDSTIDLLRTFAAQSVLAIQNARLFEDVEARTRELAKSLDELEQSRKG